MGQETRVWNDERHGYDVEGPCWTCDQPIRYFLDEDGTPQDIVGRAATAERERAERLEAALRQSAHLYHARNHNVHVYNFDADPKCPDQACMDSRAALSGEPTDD